MFKLEVLTLLLLLISLAIKKKNTLTVLLTLEIIRIIIILITLLFGVDIFFALLIICIGACEGAVGLRTLIAMTRINIRQSPGIRAC